MAITKVLERLLSSFTLTATDDEGNSTTETISINVSDTNVPITVDEDDPVVAITGTASGLGHVNMAFGADQDPDLDEPGDAVLVLYTWSTIARDDPLTTGDDEDESVPVVVMVSTSPQPLALDATGPDGSGPPDMMNDYLGKKIMASVEYYEVDPKTGEIAHASGFSAVTEDYIKAPAPGEGPPVSVSFDFTTDTTGLVAQVTVANATPVPQSVAAVLQVSQDGEGGWITSTRNDEVSLTDTDGTGVGTVDFDVDADADATTGDGGGLHYRVVVTFGTGDDRTSQASDPIQLGDVTTDPTPGEMTDIISGATPAVGETIRVNTGGEDAEVQWQVRDSGTRPWMDIEEADELTLEVTNDQAGKMLRAKVTYMTNDDDPDTDADESTYPSWVEYTEVLTVSGDVDQQRAFGDAVGLRDQSATGAYHEGRSACGYRERRFD